VNEASNEGMKHPMRGCNSGPIGHDFMDGSSVSTSQIKNSTM